MTHPLPTEPVRVGRAVVDPRARRLVAQGTPQRVSSRAFDVLMLLIAERDRVVGKDELLATVWPRQVVEENNLQVQVAALRRVLGAESIVTVSGRGYRLAVPVQAIEEAAGEPPGQSDAHVGSPPGAAGNSAASACRVLARTRPPS